MNDLYIHQLETENKQIREQLQLCRNAINEIKEELNKTIDAKDKIIKEQVIEIERLNERINQALHKLKSSVNHFKTQRENNAVTFTIKILGDKENE